MPLTDGLVVKAGLEKAALLVVVAGLSDGRQVFLAIAPGVSGIHRELASGRALRLRPRMSFDLTAPGSRE